ncbi:MAG: citrate/2-methylcitrate synthase, partial [Pseudomonadales bacterium]|nr:citrate/2-methylcitrate synthase [Pseudomonadales bacterium]
MEYSKGLEGVIAGETAISNVEGDIGRLSYRGYSIEELIGLDYVAVMWLVMFGEIPGAEEHARLEKFLALHGDLYETESAMLERMPAGLHPMLMLQSMIPLISTQEGSFEDMSDEGSRGLKIIARLPALVATYYRLTASGDKPVFDPGLSHLENFLTMFTGRLVPKEHAEILGVVQILQMEHSFNASTFVARCVASTLAPVESVLSAATGSLFGILHGGADEAALNDAKKAGSPDAAE